MRIYELFHALVEKFVPMNENTKLELQSGALEWYNKKRDERAIREAKNKEIVEYNEAFKDEEDFKAKSLLKPTVTEKIFTILEQWYVRYIIALSFIFLVPMVKGFINGEYNKTVEDEHEDEDFSFEDYMEYKRLSRK